MSWSAAPSPSVADGSLLKPVYNDSRRELWKRPEGLVRALKTGTRKFPIAMREEMHCQIVAVLPSQ